MTKQYTNTREPGEFGDGATVEVEITDEAMEAPLHAALQRWRDEDHEDTIALSREQVIDLCEEYRAALTAALPGETGQVTYEIENEEGEFCAGSNSLADAQHYAMVYGQDHPVRLIEVTRRVISSPFALASNEPAPTG